MQNRIFNRENGRFYKMSWIPLIYYVATQGTIFNLEDVAVYILSSCIVAALGGLTQRKYEFYMRSFFIDCILCMNPFPKLNFDWDPTRTPVYSAYQILWAHNYFSFYKTICEYFLLPLYALIFLK